MSTVPERPRGANVPLSSPDRRRPLRPPRWDDPSEVLAWLQALRDALIDAVAAGEDAARRPSERMFSRAEVRRRIAEAEQAALVMIDASLGALRQVP